MMFNKLKSKVRKFLDVDYLENKVDDVNLNLKIELQKTKDELNSYKLLLENHGQTIITLHNDIKNISKQTKITNENVAHNTESINILHKTIENVVHIGTDVRQINNNNNHSWAVICVEGNMNLVKFVDLDRNNVRNILYFLKQFEAGKHCIDIPYKEMFYDGLYKF